MEVNCHLLLRCRAWDLLCPLGRGCDPAVETGKETELFRWLQIGNRFLRYPVLKLDTILTELSRR
jgi:hypothetical protein